jgi:hypothetical protein
MNGGASIAPRNRLVRDFFNHAALIPMCRAASASVRAVVGFIPAAFSLEGRSWTSGCQADSSLC